MNETSYLAPWLAWWSAPWRALANPFVSLAPQSLTQPILPGWMFANSINVTEENSSSPETEREIVGVHSYGRQLGRITDVLSDLIEKWPGGEPDVPSVKKFIMMRDEIEAVKTERIAQAITDLAAMKQRNPDEYSKLAPRLHEILAFGDSSGPDGPSAPEDAV